MDDDFAGTIFAWLIFGCLILVIFGWNDDGWVGKARYAISHGVPLDQVHFYPKPYDCDWGTAPIGAKHCSYSAVVKARNSAGEIFVGEFPKVPLIGFDLVPRDLDIARVEVGWSKVQD
jgi:hypothetical protein